MSEISLTIKDLLYVSPLIILLITGLLPVTIKVLNGNRESFSFLKLSITVVGFLASAATLIVFSQFYSELGTRDSAFYDALVFDSLTLWTGLVVLVVSAAAVFLLYDNPATKGEQFSEQLFLLSGVAIGMIVLASALDLLMVFIGLETMSLALYLLIAVSHEQKLSKEAAFKYFVLGGFASAIFLYGMAFIYGTTGTTYVHEIMNVAPGLIGTNNLFLLGLVFLVIGFAFKVSLFPFHAWTPDVYQGAPTPVTAMMSTAVKTVSFVAFLRVVISHGIVEKSSVISLFQIVAVMTMFIGNFGAIIQNNLKRMLAFSSIAHSGYIFVGLITAGSSKVGENLLFGVSSVVFYLIAYSIMTFGAFAIVSVLEKNEASRLSVDDLSGMASKHPALSLALTFFLLSLAGLPPTIGFFGKFYLFSAAINQGFIWLAVFGVINSVISVYYYLRPIVVMYMKDKSKEELGTLFPMTTSTVFVCMILVLVFGIFSGSIYNLVEMSLR